MLKIKGVCWLKLVKKHIFAVPSGRRGNNLFPFFITCIFELVQKKIEKLLSERFGEEDLEDCFLVEIIESENSSKIEVYVESDNRISYKQCGIISRYLETFLDTSKSVPEKYVLEVSSPGLDRPLRSERQFKLNKGKKVDIVMKGNRKLKGKIDEIEESEISIVLKSGKIEKISFNKIEEAKIVISF